MMLKMFTPMLTGKISKNLKILGLDPGIADLGYGLILKTGPALKSLVFGSLQTPKNSPAPERLLSLMLSLEKIIKTEKPDLAVVESLFFAKNVTTAMAVSQARGVILALLAKFKIPVLELTPPQVKQGLCGYGRADKKQMQKMVQILLKLPALPRPDDAADALALAICGSSLRLWPQTISKSLCHPK